MEVVGSTTLGSPLPPMDNLPPPPEVFPRCEKVAAKMPLVHVTSGRVGRPMFWDIASGEIPTSEAEHSYCGPVTREVEARVGFPPSVYFYAGRANPRYGDAVLAFGPQVEVDVERTATPFDSGGVAREDGRGFAFIPPEGVSRAEFARACVVGADWRPVFANWLAAYFPSGPEGYWDRPPERSDPEGLYTAENEWPAWTWEVQFSRGPLVTDAAAWTTTDSHLREIRNALENRRATPGAVDRLRQFLDRLLTPNGNDRHNEVLEQWIREACL
jgi:hypothetical protein